MSRAPTLAAKDVGAASPLEADLLGYLESRQDALVAQAIAVAKSYGYAQYTTTIRAAWVEAIETLTSALGRYLESPLAVGLGLHAEADYVRDPGFEPLRANAKRHRSMGVTLQLYVGLFKHFRNLYLDSLDGLDGEAAVRARAAGQIAAFFDAAELSIVSDWAEDSEEERLQELQARARTIALDKDRYFSIFESLRDPALLLDRQRLLVNANQAAAALFVDAAGAGEIVYLRSTRVRMAPLQALLERANEALKSDSPSLWLDTPKGRRCFDVGERTIHDAVGNMTLGHVVILHDVTTHRLAVDEAERARRAMSRFLATMSHEIRSPLHGVLGATELLREAEVDESLAYVDAIESAGRTLLGTLNNVLDYSKFEARPPQARPQPCELRLVLDDYARVARIWADRRQVPLDLSVSGQVPRFAAIDWPLVQQVLTNLVTNAIRHDSGAGVTISLGRRGRYGDGARLRFEVADRGPGVGAKHLDLLFQPFANRSRVADTSSGSGLGLAISQRLATAMGGTIGYRKRPQGGALFWFEVPYIKIAPKQAAQEAGRKAAAACATRDSGRRCLLVDDDKVGILITAVQLRRQGLQVTTALSAEAARRTAAETAFDLFVIDYYLAEENGAQLARSLRADNEAARFVALTANADHLVEVEGGDDPFHAVVSKPASSTDLLAAVEGTKPPTVSKHAFGSGMSDMSALSGVSGTVKQAMAREFTRGWADGVERLQSCLESGDRLGLAAVAHRLAGSCAVMGLADAATLLRQLESACQDDEQRLDSDAWRSCLADILRDAPARAQAIARVAAE
ncbi:MAG: ATP-binding protein [Kiloniellales bacterium]